MIIFWILAGGLLGLALLFVLGPLLRPTPPDEAPEQDALNLEVFRQRLKELDADLEAGFLDREQYDAARHDLERELLYDVDGGAVATARAASGLGRWILGSLLAVTIPTSAVLVYLEIGEPGIIDRQIAQAAAPTEDETGNAGQEAASLEVLVQRLEERLQKNAEDLDGWLMLGRTYFAIDQLDKGLKAVERAYALAPDRMEVKLALAEAIAAASPTKSLEGRPVELIEEALRQAPEDPTARWLNGMVAFQRGQYNAAAVTWRKILDTLDPASEEANNLRQMVEEANKRAGLTAAEQTPETSRSAADPLSPAPAVSVAPGVQASAERPVSDTTTAASTGASSITLEVSLDAALADKAAPEDSVFVFARAAEGPPMPLAAQRLQVRDLPKTLTLDDSMAMNPALRLSAFPEIRVGARVSKSGDATPQSGDLVGGTGPIRARDQPKVNIVIDQVRP